QTTDALQSLLAHVRIGIAFDDVDQQAEQLGLWNRWLPVLIILRQRCPGGTRQWFPGGRGRRRMGGRWGYGRGARRLSRRSNHGREGARRGPRPTGARNPPNHAAANPPT